MPYPILPGRRFEYDIGGGSIYWGNDINDITNAMTSDQMSRLNCVNNTIPVLSFEYNATVARTIWVFLPEKYVVAGLGMIHRITNGTATPGNIQVAGSPDSTNGLDGTWIAANLPSGAIPTTMTDDDVWRDSIQPCTFSESVKVIRLRYQSNYYYAELNKIVLYALHIYGVKATGELPDDILFLEDDVSEDPEFIRDMDWGDRQEGTTLLRRVKLFNSSTTKIASNLTLSLVDTDLLFSMDEGATWVTGTTITSLAPQGKSASILIKNTIPPPTQMLGPRAPRFTVAVENWL